MIMAVTEGKKPWRWLPVRHIKALLSLKLNFPAFVFPNANASRLLALDAFLRCSLLFPCLFVFPLQKTYRDFRLQGVLDGTLNNKSYETIYNRLTVEEATAAVKAGDGLQGISMRDSDEEDD